MPVAKTIRELRDFLNTVPDEFLDRKFVIHEEEDVFFLKELEYNDADMFFDPDNEYAGNMTIKEWHEFYPDVDTDAFKIGIPKGCPMFEAF